MSVITLNLIDCPDLQVQLEQTFNNRLTRTQRTPVVEFLTSQINRGGLQTFVSPGNGKTRTVDITYSPRYEVDEISTTITRDCASTNEAGMSSTTCTIDMGVGVEVNEQFGLANLVTVCKDNSLWFAERVLAMLDGCRRAMERSVCEQLALSTGSFNSNDTDGVAADIKTVSTLASSNLVFDAISEIRYSAMAAAFQGSAYVFGSTLISKYFTAVEAGCCLDQGIDINDFMGQSGIIFAHAQEVPTALGDADGFLVMDPGSAQLVWANMWDGSFNAGDNGIDSFGTINDPVTGLPFDISIVRNCANIDVQVSLPFTVCALPDDLYAIPDEMNGVNGILEFVVTNS